uniref:Helicase-associated domain-containing protein n=1 Tax=Ditylum brightwellii TaxID=49249 RepID=A0A7S4SCY3_9STRA
MTNGRIEKLEALGFEWVVASSWDLRYDELVDFVNENGHANVPSDYPANAELAEWTRTQRRQYKLLKQNRPTQLTMERIKLLDGLNFPWLRGRRQRWLEHWNRIYDELMEYKNVNGHVDVPPGHITEKGTRLGMWCRTQRRSYNHLKQKKNNSIKNVSSLTEDQINLLEKISFKWTMYKNPYRSATLRFMDEEAVVANCHEDGGDSTLQKRETDDCFDYIDTNDDDDDSIHHDNDVDPIAVRNLNSWPPSQQQQLEAPTGMTPACAGQTGGGDFCNLGGPPPHHAFPPPPVAPRTDIAVEANLITEGTNFNSAGQPSFNLGETHFITNRTSQNTGVTNFVAGGPSPSLHTPPPLGAHFNPGGGGGVANFNSGPSDSGPDFNYALKSNFNPPAGGGGAHHNMGNISYINRGITFNVDGGKTSFNQSNETSFDCVGPLPGHSMDANGSNFNTGGGGNGGDVNFVNAVSRGNINTNPTNFNTNEQMLGISTAGHVALPPKTWNYDAPVPWIDNGTIPDNAATTAPPAVAWGIANDAENHVRAPHNYACNQVQESRHNSEDNNLMRNIGIPPTCAIPMHQEQQHIHPVCNTPIQQQQQHSIDPGVMDNGAYDPASNQTQGEWQGLWGDDSVAMETDTPAVSGINQSQHDQAPQQMTHGSDRTGPMWQDFGPPYAHHLPNASNGQSGDSNDNITDQVSIDLPIELTGRDFVERKNSTNVLSVGGTNASKGIKKTKPQKKNVKKKENSNPMGSEQTESIWMQRLKSLKQFKEKKWPSNGASKIQG